MPVKIEGIKLEKWKEEFLSWAYDKLQPVKTCREYINATREILCRLVDVLELQHADDLKKLIEETFPDYEWDPVYDEAVEEVKEALFHALIEDLAFDYKVLKAGFLPEVFRYPCCPFCIVEDEIFGNDCEVVMTCQYGIVVNKRKSCVESGTPWDKLTDLFWLDICDKYGW